MATSTAIVTLLSDFGDADPYVAMVKGVLLSAAPDARLVDIAHSLEAFDIFAAAWALLRAYSYYPAGTVHLLAVDPGFGAHAPLLARCGGWWLLGADNGALDLVLRREAQGGVAVWRIEAFGALGRANSFLARDCLAPAAAALLHGADPSTFGPRVEDWRRLTLPQPRSESGVVEAEILHVDRFGNLLTNLRAGDLAAAPLEAWRLHLGTTAVVHRSAAAAGEAFFHQGAEEWLEVSIAGAAAAQRLGVGRGSRLQARRHG